MFYGLDWWGFHKVNIIFKVNYMTIKVIKANEMCRCSEKRSVKWWALNLTGCVVLVNVCVCVFMGQKEAERPPSSRQHKWSLPGTPRLTNKHLLSSCFTRVRWPPSPTSFLVRVGLSQFTSPDPFIISPRWTPCVSVWAPWYFVWGLNEFAF